MNQTIFSGSGNKVISLSEVKRQRAALRLVSTNDHPGTVAGDHPGRALVYFITGGRFSAMVNNVSSVLAAGDYLRVPEGIAHTLTDLGPHVGTCALHRFAIDVPGGFLREIAAALPPFSQQFPRMGTAEFTHLAAIALRWGVRLEDDAAA
ncbi:MAG: hypothetical protein ACTHOR_17160 [Devosia sp.]